MRLGPVLLSLPDTRLMMLEIMISLMVVSMLVSMTFNVRVGGRDRVGDRDRVTVEYNDSVGGADFDE